MKLAPITYVPPRAYRRSMGGRGTSLSGYVCLDAEGFDRFELHNRQAHLLNPPTCKSYAILSRFDSLVTPVGVR